MPYGVIFRFKNGTREQYENTIRVLHPGGLAELPPGTTSQVAGTSEDGDWIVFASFHSRDAWQRYRNETFLKRYPQIHDGFDGPPEEICFDIAFDAGN